jgi:hypothetical protein
MTREEFIKIIDQKQYSYRIENNDIVITSGHNSEFISLIELEDIPSGVVFKNRGSVILEPLTSLPPGIKFQNKGNTYLDSVTSISPGVEMDSYSIRMESLIGGYFDDWEGNIEGIGEERLLNRMISLGIFNRK